MATFYDRFAVGPRFCLCWGDRFASLRSPARWPTVVFNLRFIFLPTANRKVLKVQRVRAMMYVLMPAAQHKLARDWIAVDG